MSLLVNEEEGEVHPPPGHLFEACNLDLHDLIERLQAEGGRGAGVMSLALFF
jgi:hypothetical protein